MNLLRRGMSLLSLGLRTQQTPCRGIYRAASVIPSPLYNFSQTLSRFSPRPEGLISRAMASLAQMHKTGPHIKKRKSRNPLNGKPFAKGVILKTLIKKPKKPNSANRKCVLVRLSNGKEMVAYIPGIGHNLQEHNIVLVRVGRVKDCPGVKLKCVRGKFDLPHVIKQKV
ncbi:small ribosomal subunit protein uS12m isoform X1 [Danaus plexippus]|uniref:small ribosomal subunit protein uS12m isoform X1 n=1 Tax=Danaus plexippus TaxID=13037 RepID=UPI0013C41434|nr:small ribosomal subunit protein uS12m isoform X1 [Danaus plexippus]